MIYKHGSYSHIIKANGSGSTAWPVSYAKSYNRDDFGNMDKVVYNMTIRGIVIESSAADFTKELKRLEAAYEKNVHVSGFFLDDKVTETAHVFKSAGSLGGIIIKSFSYPESGGAEYATQRTFQVELEVVRDFIVGGEAGGTQAGGRLSSFHETVSFIGIGGPRYVYVTPLSGGIVRQRTSDSTPQRITQSGRATNSGGIGYPSPPGPIDHLAGYEHQEQREIRLISPTRGERNSFTDWGVEWSYRYTHTGTQAVPHIG